MNEFIAAIYRFLGAYEDLDPVWQFAGDDGYNGMLWGGLVCIALSVAGAACFYFIRAGNAKNATWKNWWLTMLYTAIAVFVAEALILAGIFTLAEEIPGLGVYTHNLLADDGNLLLFSLVNGFYSLGIYFLSSLLFCRMSVNARYIPFNKKTKN